MIPTTHSTYQHGIKHHARLPRPAHIPRCHTIHHHHREHALLDDGQNELSRGARRRVDVGRVGPSAAGAVGGGCGVGGECPGGGELAERGGEAALGEGQVAAELRGELPGAAQAPCDGETEDELGKGRGGTGGPAV